MARPELVDENNNPVDEADYLRRMAEWEAANAPGASSGGLNGYPPAWQAEDNEESQTNTENDTNYNRRDVNAERASGAWKAWLLDQAKQKEAEWGWNPYDESDFMGVVRNMTNARNTQPDTYYLNEVIKNWERRNASQQGGSTGRSSGGSGGGGGGGTSYTGGLAPPSATSGWMPTYTAPVWTPPPAFDYPAFVRPTLEQAKNEPGYKFAMEQGQDALENAAGMKGILRTGGTARALLGYGQRMGEQNYQNVFNRETGVYNTNRDNAEDIWTKGYTTSKDAYGFTQRNAEQEFAPKKEEAIQNFNALMQQWLAKVGVAKDIFSEGARD